MHHGGGGGGGSGSCLMNLIASTWVDLIYPSFVSRKTLEQENERVRMSAVRHDLDSCYAMLQQRETDLQIRVKALGRQAVAYKQGKNIAAARKKMLERARTQAQLDKIQNSVLMIDMHRSTIEGASLDITVLQALKASADVMRQMGVTGDGLRAVENLVAGLDENMQSAAEITTVLSSGSVSGVVNSMAAYGAQIDEDELMRELDDMTLDEEGEAVSQRLETAADASAVAAASPAKAAAATISAKSVDLKEKKNTDKGIPPAPAPPLAAETVARKERSKNAEDEDDGSMMEMAAVF